MMEMALLTSSQGVPGFRIGAYRTLTAVRPFFLHKLPRGQR